MLQVFFFVTRGAFSRFWCNLIEICKKKTRYLWRPRGIQARNSGGQPHTGRGGISWWGPFRRTVDDGELEFGGQQSPHRSEVFWEGLFLVLNARPPMGADGHRFPPNFTGLLFLPLLCFDSLSLPIYKIRGFLFLQKRIFSLWACILLKIIKAPSMDVIHRWSASDTWFLTLLHNHVFYWLGSFSFFCPSIPLGQISLFENKSKSVFLLANFKIACYLYINCFQYKKKCLKLLGTEEEGLIHFQFLNI